MQTSGRSPTKTLVTVICILLLVFSAYMVYNTIHINSTTGILDVTTNGASSLIDVSQNNTNAKFIGTGSKSVRLTPGTYLVSARITNSLVTKSVTITDQQTASVFLDINSVANQYTKDSALLSKLPYTGPASTFLIDYYLKYTNGVSTPIITVSYSSTNAKTAALSWFAYNGFKTSDYVIQYTATAPTTSSASLGGNTFVGGN